MNYLLPYFNHTYFNDTYVFKGPENQISLMFLTICYLKYFEYDEKLKRYSPDIFFKTAQHL